MKRALLNNVQHYAIDIGIIVVFFVRCSKYFCLFLSFVVFYRRCKLSFSWNRDEKKPEPKFRLFKENRNELRFFDVCSLFAFRAINDVKANALFFTQCFVTVHCD